MLENTYCSPAACIRVEIIASALFFLWEPSTAEFQPIPQSLDIRMLCCTVAGWQTSWWLKNKWGRTAYQVAGRYGPQSFTRILSMRGKTTSS
jgi:hypothetical protein